MSLGPTIKSIKYGEQFCFVAGPDLLSAGLCSEKCGGPSSGSADPIFPGKIIGDMFFAHRSPFTKESPIFPAYKICRSF